MKRCTMDKARHMEYLECLTVCADPKQIVCKDRQFVAADVGCGVHVMNTPGFFPGYYEIQEVADGVATLYVPVGDAGATGGRGTLGGSLIPASFPQNLITKEHLYGYVDG